jgi:hypothetical protein
MNEQVAFCKPMSQHSRQTLSETEHGWKTFLLLAVLLIVLLASLIFFTRMIVVSAMGTRVDFFPRLEGTRAFWAGKTPYSAEVTARIQVGMFGEELLPGEDEQRMAHPAYTAVLLSPLIFFDNEMAVAVWSAVQLLAFFSTLLLWFAIVGWQPKSWQAALLLLGFVLVFRYPMVTYVLGQFVGTLLFSVSLAIYLLQRRQHTWAGVVLIFSMMPPSYSAVLVCLLLGAEVVRGHWHGILSFVVGLGAITLFTILRVGWWIPDWLAQLRAYSEYANPYWPPATAPLPLQVLCVAVLLALLLWSLRRYILKPLLDHHIDFVCVSLLTLSLLLPQTGSYYLAMLIPVGVVASFRAATQKKRRLPLAGAIGLFVLLPWLFQLNTGYAALEAFAMPLAALMLWWITRPIRVLPPQRQQRAHDGVANQHVAAFNQP